jgi:hypothetical protein
VGTIVPDSGTVNGASGRGEGGEVEVRVAKLDGVSTRRKLKFPQKVRSDVITRLALIDMAGGGTYL